VYQTVSQLRPKFHSRSLQLFPDPLAGFGDVSPREKREKRKGREKERRERDICPPNFEWLPPPMLDQI